MLLRAVLLSALTALATAAPASASQRKMPPNPKRTINREFRELIRKNHRDFERCGDAEAERTKRRVKGILQIRYIVNGDGMVTESGPVHNTTKSRFVADCVVRTLERIRFPATFGPPLTNSYTFKFNAKVPGKK